MQKDVIYIDVEDDITAIIGKVKEAKHKIVALVPPKRIGVLQSAVNLRLLARAAKQNGRRLVLITSNKALAGLAATAAIPVAKNLQTKPEMAEIAALEIDDGDDVIDGSELPVGDHAKQSGLASDDIDDSVIAAAGLASTETVKKAAPPSNGETPKPKVKKGSKVPNFNTFRKKLVLIIVGVVLLIGLIVWAVVFAPRAKVIVSTRTTDAAISQQVNLSSSTQTSAKNNIIKATTKQHTDDISVDFSATGKKDVGEKASGVVEFSTRDIDNLGMTIPAGTVLTSASGAEYLTDDSVTFTLENYRGATTGITAAERGKKYNGASGPVGGAPDNVNASISKTTSGGTDKVIKVFTASDIEKAKDAIDKEIDQEAAQANLKDQFGDEFVVIESSLQVSKAGLKTDAKPGQEGDKASYGGPVTYTMYAVAKDELKQYLTDVLEKQIDNSKNQRVYDAGSQEASFTNVDKSDNGLRATLSTNGKIGPKITEDEVKELAKDKRYSDIQSSIEAINGVDSVNVEFSPFWVSKSPANTDKITVEFKLDE